MTLAAAVTIAITVLAVLAAFIGKQERAAEEASYERDDEGELL